MDSDEHTRSTCGVLDLRQQLVRRCVWQWTVAAPTSMVCWCRSDRRRRFGAAPAMMVPTRRGATNTTLAATQRHPPRSPSLSPTRAREALMMAGAGGAMRATGWRATAIRFQQFGEGGSYGIAR